MCMCGKPTINGEPGYSWDGKNVGTYPAHGPTLHEGDVLLYDEPGRCGGLDSHSHHVRIVKGGTRHFLLIAHGGGEERIDMGIYPRAVKSLAVLDSLDSNGRYWLLMQLYDMQRQATRDATAKTEQLWRQAAAEKRIKTRKRRGSNTVRVWIDSTPAPTPGGISTIARRA